MKPSIGAQLRGATQRLAQLDQGAPAREAQILLGLATSWSRETLLAWPERLLTPEQASRFEDLVRRRLAGEPIAYLRGDQPFWTLRIQVSPATLIPRPETERLVEIALEYLPEREPLRVADVGTGSGAIAAALGVERPAWTLIALDREAPALAVAARNLKRYAPNQTHLVRGDWLAPIAPRSLDAILGNPPYIPPGDPHLTQGDLRREPRIALVSGAQGLAALIQIIRQAADRLRPGGFLALEHGFDQGPRVREHFRTAGFGRIETHRDLSGHPRVTRGFWMKDG